MAGSPRHDSLGASHPRLVTKAEPPHASHWSSVARLGVQVADALQYAHAQGTLHRDIKPANLIIDRQDVVWVADFGLAKALESQPGSHSGDIVGTLAYMAPEQLRGRADHRSDIYSLGLTLYELLTWRSAFEQTDQADLLQRIAKHGPVRPRQVRAEIPRDLETIVLKAIQIEPKRRYQSAAELGADLQRFLEDRPVRARRATVVERCWRWCRRNPTVAALSATAITLLILIAVTASIGYARTSAALAGERKQRENAEAATDVAVEVLDRIYERFAPPSFVAQSGTEDREVVDSLDVKPVLSEGAASVLEDLLVFYDRLAESGQEDSLYWEKVALAKHRIGDIRHHLGQVRQAEAAYQNALDLYRRIDAETGQEAHLVEIAVLNNELGIMALRLNRPEQARRQFQDNLEFLDSLDERFDANPQLFLQMLRASDCVTWLDNASNVPLHGRFDMDQLPPRLREPLPGQAGFNQHPPRQRGLDESTRGQPPQGLGPPGTDGSAFRDLPPGGRHPTPRKPPPRPNERGEPRDPS
jgi:tetratricopeptide (TPR) repeat protein